MSPIIGDERSTPGGTREREENSIGKDNGEGRRRNLRPETKFLATPVVGFRDAAAMSPQHF
jgi:hypothetical protein